MNSTNESARRQPGANTTETYTPNDTAAPIVMQGVTSPAVKDNMMTLNINSTEENSSAHLTEIETIKTGKINPPTTESGAQGSRIVALDIVSLLALDFPPMEALLSPWLCKQHLSMVHAWRGVGKTHFALGVAYAVAGGGSFLKWKADKPRTVVYIDGEMAGAAIKDRLTAILDSTPENEKPPEGYFRIITPDAQPFPLPDLSTKAGQMLLAPYIADADLIVVDNLSCLMRSGNENEAESWVPIAEWALDLRRQGKAILFVAHDGKSKTQRGTSKKEDIMDVVIQLEHSNGYKPEQGAAFGVKFRKARHLQGDDAQDIEVILIKDGQGKQVWTWQTAEACAAKRIIALHKECPDLNQTQIADEIGCNRSTVSRALKETSRHATSGIQ